MQTTLENIKKVATDSPRSVLKKKNKIERGANNCTSSAKNCIGSQTDYKSTTYDMSTRQIAEGMEAKGTIDDISQEKQSREQSQEVHWEHDIRVLEGEEDLHFGGDVYEDWMETIASPQHFQHLQ